MLPGLRLLRSLTATRLVDADMNGVFFIYVADPEGRGLWRKKQSRELEVLIIAADKRRAGMQLRPPR